MGDSIVSDRDNNIISAFWKGWMMLFSLDLNISSRSHHRTNGGSKIMNQMEKILFDKSLFVSSS